MKIGRMSIGDVRESICGKLFNKSIANVAHEETNGGLYTFNLDVYRVLCYSNNDNNGKRQQTNAVRYKRVSEKICGNWHVVGHNMCTKMKKVIPSRERKGREERFIT